MEPDILAAPQFTRQAPQVTGPLLQLMLLAGSRKFKVIEIDLYLIDGGDAFVELKFALSDPSKIRSPETKLIICRNLQYR